jgi:hypothetical protein
MKQTTFLLALLLSVSSGIYAQANGSFYTFQLGNKEALFKYANKGDSLRSLTLMDTTEREVNIKYGPHDTVQAINPKTHETETKIISYPSFDYHIEATMSYSDFLLLLKSKFELKNPQRNLRVYSFNIYYETADRGGMIKVKYPQTIEGVIAKLNGLDAKGGFILLSLKAADHDAIPIDAGGAWLALIHIKN